MTKTYSRKEIKRGQCEEVQMTKESFRPGWYQNNSDPPVTIADVEKAYMDARKAHDARYSHPGWGSVAHDKARILIDILTMCAHENGIDVSITTVVYDCVSRWGEFQDFVRHYDRRSIVPEEPSIGVLIRHFALAVNFSFLEQKEQRRRNVAESIIRRQAVE
jgi:hypothetical protein